jgi:hypothetical protein
MCGLVIRSRASKNHTGQENLFKALTNHQRKNHRQALNRRIKAGIARSKEAVSGFDIGEFKENLEKNPTEAFKDILRRDAKPRMKVIRLIDKWVAPFLIPPHRALWDVIKFVGEGKTIFVKAP